MGGNDNTLVVVAIVAVLASVTLVAFAPAFAKSQGVPVARPTHTIQATQVTQATQATPVVQKMQTKEKRTTSKYFKSSIPLRRSKRVVEQRKPRSITINAIPQVGFGGPVAAAATNGFIEIRHNSGGGDCLFLSFKEAITSLGVTVTVEELRGIVAESMTEDQFFILKTIYDGAVEEKEYDVIKDYSFMRGVDDLEGLRKAMLTTDYWGDEIALRAIEEASGISAVVITSGPGRTPVVAKKIDDDVESTTDRFIILLLENSHYQLATYKGAAVLKREVAKEAIEAITSSS